MHQGQSAVDAVAISSLGRSESDGGKRRLDRIGCSQVLPVCCREVVEGQQPVAIGGKVFRRLGILVAKGRQKAFERPFSGLSGIRLPDFVEH